MEAAVRDRRDEPLLAELRTFLGRDVGGDTLQLAGDAPPLAMTKSLAMTQKMIG
jgi:hypothetical protein